MCLFTVLHITHHQLKTHFQTGSPVAMEIQIPAESRLLRRVKPSRARPAHVNGKAPQEVRLAVYPCFQSLC